MVEEFVDRLETECGDALRGVLAYDALDYDLEYFRQDLRERYSARDVEKVHREVISDGLSMDAVTSVMDAGRQEARITVFEDVIVLAFPSDTYEGILVSYDRDADTTILDVVDVARSTLPTFDD